MRGKGCDPLTTKDEFGNADDLLETRLRAFYPKTGKHISAEMLGTF